jgi:hypothetical protein
VLDDDRHVRGQVGPRQHAPRTAITSATLPSATVPTSWSTFIIFAGQ